MSGKNNNYKGMEGLKMSNLTKMQFPEGYQCQYKETVMRLANMIEIGRAHV